MLFKVVVTVQHWFAGFVEVIKTKTPWVTKIEGTRMPERHKVIVSSILRFTECCSIDGKQPLVQRPILPVSGAASGSFALYGGSEFYPGVLRSSVRFFRMGSPKRADW